ncbi:MAG: cytochrome P450 [Acidimicrobiia bacterium]
MTTPITPGPSVFEAGLPAFADPAPLPAGECPWQRYARAGHDSWAGIAGPTVVVRDQAVARAILADTRFQQGIRVRMEQTPGLDPRFVARRMQGFLLRDGPDHLRMRRIASKAFTPRAADRHRPFMREVMDRLADAVPPDGVCDAVATLTHAYPILVICRVLGAPAGDVELFSRLAETILNAQSGAPDVLEAAMAAHDELDRYVLSLMDRRRTDPGEDLLTDLLRAEAEEGRLSAEEVLNAAVSVIMAGTDTTRNQLAIGLHLFAERPDAWDALADDGRLDVAVDELLRFAPIGHVLLRVPNGDVVVHGVTIPAGTMVVLDIGAANRDPSMIDDGDRFDVERPSPPGHLGFGHGHKYCLGANLAKAELAEALRVLRRRFPTIAPAGETVWRRVGFVQGPIELPLRFGRAG